MQMRILVAPNAMKGSLSAEGFAEAVQKGLRRYSPHIETMLCPVADGGDGTGSILAKVLEAKPTFYTVHDPLGNPIEAPVYQSGDLAIIEMADASGIKLLPWAKLDPMNASSYGTGQLLRLALESGVREIIVGVGGSATVDGGTGCLEALGLNLFDRDGGIIHGNGSNLQAIQQVSWKDPIDWSRVIMRVACDVNNAMTGPAGATRVFGPQKGATPDQVAELEAGLLNWSGILHRNTTGIWRDGPFCGAAGGIAGALQALCGAELVSGAAWILKKIDFEERIRWADVVITGEGKMDSQSRSGKASFLVAQLTKKYGKRVIGIAGRIEGSFPLFDLCFPLCSRKEDEDYCQQHAARLVEDVAYNIFYVDSMGQHDTKRGR